ncbi:MAG TPA: glycoside hydrolase family 15 protein [Mycobacteriales bacterium]
MASRIEDYAVVGDLNTLALIDRDGSVDWFCAPRFDSSAVFASLLGDGENGRFRIGPAEGDARVRRSYREGSLVLDTESTTDSGTVRLTDFMRIDGGRPALVRIVTGVQGSVEMELDLRFRFDYGRTTPWVRRMGHRLVAVAGPNMMVLDSPVEPHGRKFSTRAMFSVHEGDTLAFVLRWQPSHLDLEESLDAGRELERTLALWHEWSSRNTYDGGWPEPVSRSLITLKALTYQPTGGIVAAGTTSLPELLGGERNWDYRYCWLRDSTFTLASLLASGYTDEAAAWREWLLRAIAGDPAQLQIMYGVAGERELSERSLDWLAGYEKSVPVRVGNGAVNQRQLDVYGEVLDALFVARTVRLEVREERGAPNMGDASWPLQLKLLDYLESSWQEPDEGIWEVRGGQQHFTHSKVMTWVALDRAVRTLEIFDRPGPHDRWSALRDQIKAEVLAKGFDADANTFVQAYGSQVVDASALLFPMVGFLSGDDPRVRGTVEAVEKRLLHDGFVQRYERATDDGLSGGEGAFLMCSFWLANNYAMIGRRADAERLFRQMLDLRNDVGLLAEEYDPAAGRMLGNFPQAFSHTALINTAYVLDRHMGGRGIRHPESALEAAEHRRHDGHHRGDMKGR